MVNGCNANTNINEIDRALGELNLAIKNHYEWAGKLLRLELLGGEPDEDLIHSESHRRCHFRYWLDTQAEMDGLQLELINEINRWHESVHHRARLLTNAIVSSSVTDELLDDYLKTQQGFIQAIDSYKVYLFSLRNLHDTLTGLPLRQLLYSDFALRRQRCRREDKQLWLLIMDIDRFKRINDTWGHNAGDEVLRSVALTLKAGTRCKEGIYRFGGEEFVMLLEADNEREAARAGARICRYLEQHPIKRDGEEIQVTVTGGLTPILQDETLHEAIGRADKAMYFGKTSGRNRCIVTGPKGEFINVS